MQVMVNVNEFKKIIKQTVKESVREVMSREIMKLHAEILNYISNEEQKEIESSYEKPEKKVAKRIEVEL